MKTLQRPLRLVGPVLTGLLLIGCTGPLSAQPPEVVSEEADSSGAPAAPAEPVEHVRGDFDQEHELWTRVLAKHVQEDDFDYGALAKDQEVFRSYLKQLGTVTPEELESWSEAEQFAFWINVYNAFTIELVVDEYPLKSIRDLDRALGLKSVFDREFIPLKAHHPDGKDDRLSLNDIEHEILRKRFKDARLHAAVNCASESCPPLRAEAFVAARLEEQLDDQMRKFVNDASRNRYDAKKGDMRISEIFKWFEEDFARDAESVKAYLLRYASEQNAAVIRKAKLRYLDYDWALNDAGE